MTTASGNFAMASQAVADADAAIRAVRAYLEEPPSGADGDALLALSAAVEAGRTARRAVSDACTFLTAEALDRGVSLRELDWTDGQV